MAWIRDHVTPGAPEETRIVFGIDRGEQAEPGERAVFDLLGSSMEGEEGVFYLLPGDLCYEVARSGAEVTITLLTAPVTETTVEWVAVLSATIPFPEGAELPGPPIVVIDHDGVVGLDELVASIPESGVHIVGPKPGAEV